MSAASTPSTSDQRPRRKKKGGIGRLFLHEDERMHERADWFLIAHGILLEAFLSAREHTEHERSAQAIGVFSLLTALAWLLTGLRQHVNIEVLRNAYKEESYSFRWMHRQRQKHGWFLGRFGRATPWFSWVIPGAAVAMWILLLSGKA